MRTRAAVSVLIVVSLGITMLTEPFAGYPAFITPAHADSSSCPTVAQVPTIGNGSSVNPYRIATAENLLWLRNTQNSLTPITPGTEFLQTADISMAVNGSSRCEWTTMIGTATAIGFTYDGGGHEIRDLDINIASGAAGLFNRLGSSSAQATIRNLGFTGNVTGTTNVGGLVAELQRTGVIDSSYATGSVTGTANVGGLVGVASGTPQISNSYATGSVSGNRSGGLIAYMGDNTGSLTITDSYALGPVSGSDRGGLLSTNQAGPRSVTASFWNTDTGPATSGGGTGKTTSELKDIATYSAWNISTDFSDAATWTICPAVNDGYPFLTAFYTSDPCSGGGDGPAATSPQPTYTFSFLTSGGGTCLPTVTVRRFERYTLPPAVVACTTLGTSMVGWSIPGQDWAFAPGRVVTVVDNQVFTAMAREPRIEITYDANVGMSSPCLIDGVNVETQEGRSSSVEVARDSDTATLAMNPPCTPIGFDLIGWTDANTPDGSGQAQSGAQTYEPGAAIPDSWNIDDPNPVNRVRLYALWGRSAS